MSENQNEFVCRDDDVEKKNDLLPTSSSVSFLLRMSTIMEMTMREMNPPPPLLQSRNGIDIKCATIVIIANRRKEEEWLDWCDCQGLTSFSANTLHLFLLLPWWPSEKTREMSPIPSSFSLIVNEEERLREKKKRLSPVQIYFSMGFLMNFAWRLVKISFKKKKNMANEKALCSSSI